MRFRGVPTCAACPPQSEEIGIARAGELGVALVRRYRRDQAAKGQTCNVEDMLEDRWSEAQERHDANNSYNRCIFLGFTFGSIWVMMNLCMHVRLD
jgi:hypothetical protein